ncbi:MAG: radical SAM protein [Patescibacteria group bacterium]|jgi:radical SAM protein with 4Fe4S-binding SPASM domain
MDYNIKKEINQFIYKYQKEDVNEKLGKILGDDFKKYRNDFNKTQNYHETKFIPDFPITISLELVNRCNLDCIMCLENQHTQPKSQLSLDDIKRILDESQKNNMPSIELGLGSEVMMYKDIQEVVMLVKKAGILDVFFSTNGILLNDEIIRAIIDNKITRIKISLDAATEETYKKIRRRAPSLKITEDNIKKIIAWKKKKNSPIPVIRLSFIIMDINKHEIKQFIDKWKDEVDYIDFQKLIDFSHVGKTVLLDEVKQEVIKDSFCAYPFYSLNIWANGDVSPCCTFYGKDLIMGNIHQQTLKEIWNSKKMKLIREQLYSKKFNPICQKCLYFRD